MNDSPSMRIKVRMADTLIRLGLGHMGVDPLKVAIYDVQRSNIYTGNILRGLKL